MEIKAQIVEVIHGKKVTKISLINNNAVEVGLLTLGATWQEFLVPRDDGSKKNLVIGFDKPSDYWQNPLCAGQSIGRVAGRIDGGHVKIDGKCLQLPQNEKGNCLHGGPQGFHKHIWAYRLEEEADGVSAVMFYQAREAIDGFPGNMAVKVRYTLDNDNRLTITYTGSQATETTLFNPTNHVYFNLGDRQDLTRHQLILLSHQYLETRDDLVPTGKFLDVNETPYDFVQGQNLGAAIVKTGGLDDAFVVEPSLEKPAGFLTDEDSGDRICFYSDRNAWVIYSMGGIPDGIYPSRDNGRAAQPFEALALEGQFLPDAINHDDFGDITIEPGEILSYSIAFEYSRKNQ